MLDNVVTDALLRVEGLCKWYPIRKSLFGQSGTAVKAVDGVSFEIRQGEILSLVGESGSGKSTVGRTVLRLETPTAGAIYFADQCITGYSRKQMRGLRRDMQMVFQDPYSSLNPKHTIERILSAPLEIQMPQLTRPQRQEAVDRMLVSVGLAPAHRSRYPHEFSGGQRQRIGLARALITSPKLLVADEPASALDVSVQAQVINLMLELKQQLGLTMLFISHDLALVSHISDRIAVMYLGRLVEIAETEALFGSPRHPYTRALLSAVPIPDPTQRRKRRLLAGDMPNPMAPPSGCAFRTRCEFALPACAETAPVLRSVGRDHAVACIRDELAAA